MWQQHKLQRYPARPVYQGKVQQLFQRFPCKNIIEGIKLNFTSPSCCAVASTSHSAGSRQSSFHPPANSCSAAGVPHSASHDLASVPLFASRDIVDCKADPRACGSWTVAHSVQHLVQQSNCMTDKSQLPHLCACTASVCLRSHRSPDSPVQLQTHYCAFRHP